MTPSECWNTKRGLARRWIISIVYPEADWWTEVNLIGKDWNTLDAHVKEKIIKLYDEHQSFD